jgi:hypothetical protein
VPELPQITIDPMLYNAIVCGLFTALSWNAVALVTRWRKERKNAR